MWLSQAILGGRFSTDISSSQLNVHLCLVISLIKMFVFTLNGLAPPKIATFSFGDAPLNFGESASVQCTVSGGDLPMSVEWTLNGRPIPTYLEVSTPKIGKRIHVLSIDSVKADHAGNYSCVATNQAGMAEFTAPLIVIGLSTNGSATFAIFPTLRVRVRHDSAVFFQLVLKYVDPIAYPTVCMNSPVILFC